MSDFAASAAGNATQARPPKNRRVVVAGVGHIGRYLPLLVAETHLVDSLLLIDRGRVRPSHIRTEGYSPGALGRFKSDVFAESCAELHPGIEVESRPMDLEDVPIGDFAADVCLGALDSLRARQVLASERAFPLGVPVVDGGVGDTLMGRVHVFHPGSACQECGWGPAAYRHLSTEYSCVPDRDYAAPSTTAPSYVGSTVAALMVAEMSMILTGSQRRESCEIFFDLASRRFLTSRLSRARACRFDHEVVTECLYLSVPFDAARIGDMLGRLRERFDGAPVHLEFRRRIIRDDSVFGSQRRVTPVQLERWSSRPLADLGLTCRDRIRVRPVDPACSVFLALDSPAQISRSVS